MARQGWMGWLAGLVFAAGCTTPAASGSPPVGPVVTAPAATSTRPTTGTESALTGLGGLRIAGRASMTGYTRAEFGQAWTDDTNEPLSHNGCDTRNDILRRDLMPVRTKPGTDGCVVLSGVLHDPYTGRTISFVRGTTTSTAVQIDHVVALGDAWQLGAQRWTISARTDFANDPLELLAVDGPINNAKGDADAASWLPPDEAFRCSYVARQIAVKERYALAVTQAEYDAMGRVLATCPAQPLPTE